MPASDLKFEIGHVLFMDIVGYSKLVIDKQTELTRKLNEIVRGSPQFHVHEAEGTLVRLPTGDGIALGSKAKPPHRLQPVRRSFLQFPRIEGIYLTIGSASPWCMKARPLCRPFKMLFGIGPNHRARSLPCRSRRCWHRP
jgi:hypothetical protein